MRGLGGRYRQERDSAVAMLEQAEERVQQLGLLVEELQGQVREEGLCRWAGGRS